MKKNRFFVCALALLLPVLFASVLPAQVNANSVATPPSQDLQEQVAGLLANNPQRAFEFTQQKYLAALSQPLRSSGRLLIAPDGTVTWEIREPLAIRYVLNANSVTEIDERGERAMPVQDNPVAAALAAAMSAALFGQWRGHEDLAQIRLQGTLAQWHMQMQLQSSVLQRLLQSIDIDGSAGQMQQIVIRESSGDRSEITLRPLAVEKTVP